MAKRDPLFDELNKHQVPQWYDDAKFGIFIHWGIFNVPSFAPNDKDITELVRDHYDEFQARLPYVEFYWQAMRIKGSATQKFHEENYGADFEYPDFREEFEERAAAFDAESWAKAFKAAGARYVVLVTKHHDGYCLWPTGVENPNRPGWHSNRDFVGELAAAVRAEGMKFGLYYSGGLDWTWTDVSIETAGDSFRNMLSSKAYNRYVDAQFRELIDRYKPDVLWNDISYPRLDGLAQLMADYYKAVPDGVINDRWNPAGWLNAFFRPRFMRPLLNFLGKRMLAKADPDAAFVGPKPHHSDFRTPEYSRYEEVQEEKWESTRGMSLGFGHNRMDREEHMMARDELLHSFIDAVSKNGNLLLNVGPTADTDIPQLQAQRLEWIGAFLSKNGTSIYDTKPWTRAEGKTDQGHEVRFTQSKDGQTINAIVLADIDPATVSIDGVDLADGQQLNIVSTLVD